LRSTQYGGAQVDFVFQLSKEMISPLTLSPFISYTETYRTNLYRAVALMYSLYRESLDVNGFDVNEAESIGSLSLSDQISRIVNDSRFTDRFEEDLGVENIAIPSEELISDSDASGDRRFGVWQDIPWLGLIMDKQYPWIFHVDLGWMYSYASTSSNIWFYSENIKVGDQKIGWFWTSDQVFNQPTSAGVAYENMRFIFIVQKDIYDSYLGSWALLNIETREAIPYGWFSLGQ